MAKDEQYPRITFRMGTQLKHHIAIRADEHTSLDAIAKRDLERYYNLLWRSLPTFSEQEALFIVDVLNGSINQPYTASLLWAQISQAVKEGFAEKWQVDGDDLVEKLRLLTPFECMAIEDAVERYWLGPYRKEGSRSEALKAVGLVSSPLHS